MLKTNLNAAKSEDAKKQLKNKYSFAVLKETKNNIFLELKNLTKFYETLAKSGKQKLENKKQAGSDKVDALIADKQQKTRNKRNKVFAKINK
ncbi:MAG: hypothetical protein K2L48_02280 [Mycoplasmoidaceae bacterium]|nr:hypothetical protein [Mycoplasmoidaceae bacterium]